MLATQQWAGGGRRIRSGSALTMPCECKASLGYMQSCFKKLEEEDGRGGENERRKEGKVEKREWAGGTRKDRGRRGSQGSPFCSPLSSTP